MKKLTKDQFQYIDTTLEKAKPNVRINGKKFEEVNGDDGTPLSRRDDLHAHTDLCSDREIEPFDEALDRETWSLYNQRLQWDIELATKRRKRPQEVADLFEYLFKAREASMGDLDEPPEEEEDRPDPSLPDGQLFVQVAGLIADIAQKLHLQRRGMSSPMWLASPRVYPRCVRFLSRVRALT